MLDVSEGQMNGSFWRLLSESFLPRNMYFKIYFVRNIVIFVTSDRGQVNFSCKTKFYSDFWGKIEEAL